MDKSLDWCMTIARNIFQSKRSSYDLAFLDHRSSSMIHCVRELPSKQNSLPYAIKFSPSSTGIGNGA